MSLKRRCLISIAHGLLSTDNMSEENLECLLSRLESRDQEIAAQREQQEKQQEAMQLLLQKVADLQAGNAGADGAGGNGAPVSAPVPNPAAHAEDLRRKKQATEFNLGLVTAWNTWLQ